MKRLAIVIGLALPVLGGGCKSGDPPVDPNEAATALRTALEAWKQGENYGTLEKRTPPIYFNEPEWRAGRSLVTFEVGKVELRGRQGICSVKLSLRDPEGRISERKIGYQIDTTPQVVIAREGLGP